MDVDILATETGLSPKMLRYLARKEIINEQLTCEQLYFLKSIASIFNKTEFIRLQVAKFNITKRARLVFTADLTPLESCILSRWLGHYAGLEEGSYNLSVELVVAEVMAFKNLSESKRPYVTKVALKMRLKARNLVYRSTDSELVAKATALTDPQKARQKKQEAARMSKVRASSGNFSQNDLFGY